MLRKGFEGFILGLAAMGLFVGVADSARADLQPGPGLIDCNSCPGVGSPCEPSACVKTCIKKVPLNCQ
jgi:hypothetical protein